VRFSLLRKTSVHHAPALVASLVDLPATLELRLATTIVSGLSSLNRAVAAFGRRASVSLGVYCRPAMMPPSTDRMTPVIHFA
jgi:hypothetical protein